MQKHRSGVTVKQRRADSLLAIQTTNWSQYLQKESKNARMQQPLFFSCKFCKFLMHILPQHHPSAAVQQTVYLNEVRIHLHLHMWKDNSRPDSAFTWETALVTTVGLSQRLAHSTAWLVPWRAAWSEGCCATSGQRKKKSPFRLQLLKWARVELMDQESLVCAINFSGCPAHDNHWDLNLWSLNY